MFTVVRFSAYQMFVADIVGEVILGTDIMNAYGFVVDLRENVVKVGQGKIKLSIKQVALAEEDINRSGQAEMEEERAEEIPKCNTTKEVNRKPTICVEETFLLVLSQWKCPRENLPKIKLRKKLLTRTKQTGINVYHLSLIHIYQREYKKRRKLFLFLVRLSKLFSVKIK